MTYIMESGAETQRLIAQQRADNVRQALALTGLRPGAHVLDAGCGPGVITGELAEVVGPSGRVTGLELSPERLEEARRLNAHRPEVSFVQADIRRTGLPDASFDYSWSQFVLEYLPDRRVAIEELMRVTRPGGKVVVSEIDGLGFNNWPFPESLHARCLRFAEAVAGTGFDLFIGRKLFKEFRQLGLREVRVHLMPQYVIAGPADERMMVDWETRFATLEPVVASALGGRDAYQAMCREYLQLLADPDGLKYSVLLVTEGTRP